jgi:hypothetical protein
VLIILLTKHSQIVPESAFTWQPGGTIMAGFEMPRDAGSVLGIKEPRPLKVLPHYSALIGQTYGFVWDRIAYRVVVDFPGAPMPLVLSGIEHHDHWQACKACRDGVWCGVGYRLILDEMEGQA